MGKKYDKNGNPIKEPPPVPDPPSAPFYMGTYGDMITLLMCFFVLLFAISYPDPVLLENATKSIKGAFGILEAQESPVKSKSIQMTDMEISRRLNMYESMIDMESMIEELDMVEKITIENTETGVVIRFSDEVLFAKGSARLRPECFDVLTSVGIKILEKKPKSIQVEGHTDSTPIRSRMFPSNWELSSARATSVVKFFISRIKMDPGLLQATGHGEFKPIAPNNSLANMSKNRRVEVIVTDRSSATTILK